MEPFAKAMPVWKGPRNIAGASELRGLPPLPGIFRRFQLVFYNFASCDTSRNITSIFVIYAVLYKNNAKLFTREQTHTTQVGSVIIKTEVHTTITIVQPIQWNLSNTCTYP